MSNRPLTVTSPGAQTFFTTSPDGAALTYIGVTVTGGTPPYRTTYSRPPGALFPVGTTTVTVAVVDRRCRTARTSFAITLETDHSVGRAAGTSTARAEGAAIVAATVATRSGAGSAAGASVVDGRGVRLTDAIAPATVLNPSIHCAYEGCFGLPLVDYVATRNPFYAWGSMTGRVVAGQPRIFMLSAHSEGAYLLEFTPPAVLAATPDDLNSSASYRAVMSRDWGNIYGEDPNTGNVKRQNGPGSVCDVDGQILFLNGKLYWTFFHSYNVSNFNDRCIGLSELNDGTGVATRRGPWRVGSGTRQTSKFCGGHLAEIPDAFAVANLAGQKLHVGNQTSSGVATAPLGITFFALPEITSPPAEDDIADPSDHALTPQEVLAYRSGARQPVTIEGWRRRVCGWADPGNHAVTTAPVAVGATSIPIDDCARFAVDDGSRNGDGSITAWYGYVGLVSAFAPFGYDAKSATSGPGNLTGIPASGPFSIASAIPAGTVIGLGKYDNGRGGTLVDPVPYFGPDDGSDLSTFWDYTSGPVWINSPSGKQGVIWLGAVADSIAAGPYGSDDRTHVRYAGQAICPHGQDASAVFQGTGPVSTSTTMVGWVYDQADLARVIAGTLNPADLIPRFHFRWNTIGAGIGVQPTRGGGLKQAWYDPVHSKLYISEQNRDLTFGAASPLNVVHRFSVS